MISSSYKPKASKSSTRDFSDYQAVDQQQQGDENCELESLDGDNATANNTGETNRRFNFYNNSSRDGRYNNKMRSKQNEYKSNSNNNRSNNVDRRGYVYRNRGITARRNEYSNENNASLLISRKYQDGLNRAISSDTGHNVFQGSKNYDSDLNSHKKNEVKFNLPEDTRISKLLRRLSIESDQENSLVISKKLLEVLMLPDNAHYIRKAFHILGESMLNIFQSAPGPVAKRQAARGLGRMGYILAEENDFDRFQTWFFSKLLNSNEDIQHLFMQALREIIHLENIKPVLQKYAFGLMRELVIFIEVTDNIDIFKGALENLIAFVELYNDEFYPLFRDTIDLLFGWHVDHTQPLTNVDFISKNMQRISKHFQNNLEFSVTLLLHFVEDIETYTLQLHKTDSDDASENSSIEHVTVFILALNTVLKCLGDSLKSQNEYVSLKLLTDCLHQIVKTATQTLEAYVPDNMTIAANESLSILLEVVGPKTIALNNSILNLIDLQLSLMHDFSDAATVSMLLMIAKVIKEISANLPIELIPKLVGPDSEIIKYRASFYTDIQEAVICVYQSLLNLKNIPLLQEAYRYVLGDLETAYKLIVPDVKPLTVNNPYATQPSCTVEDAEITVLFLLRCLSQLANASSSIIGMWALKPSILELLGVLLQPQHPQLTKVPALQYSILYLLHSHCKCYNYFISSSSLITIKDNVMRLALSDCDKLSMEDVSSQSPNSGNLCTILCVINRTLKNKLNTETYLLLLNWLHDILLHSYSYLEVLCMSREFDDAVNTLIETGYNPNVQVALSVCKNLETLLSNKQLNWKNDRLLKVIDLCSLHAKSNDKELRERYVALSIYVPWDVSVTELGKIATIRRTVNSLETYNNASLMKAQQLHTNNAFSEMSASNFKLLMRYLLERGTANNLQQVFVASWPIEMDAQQSICDRFREIALTSRCVLDNWSTWESALYCVNNKLRTPLGKPNETFTAIESALKELHKSLRADDDEDADKTVYRPERVRLLLQFMEHLELLMMNASDGCSMTLTQPSKPVRTFFTTNASTCKEWLTRIRLMLIQLALHSGQSTIALRHGYAILKELCNANDCANSNFETAVVHVTLALLNLRETEALNGLYLWSKSVAKRNFKFIKIAAEQANNRYENVAINYKNLLKEMGTDGGGDQEKNVYDSKTFVKEQLLNSYKELHDWQEIAQMKAMRLYYANVDTICANAVRDLDRNVKGFAELSSWQDDEDYATSKKKTQKRSNWSIYESYRSAERRLYEVAFDVGKTESKALTKKLESVLHDVRFNVQETLLISSEFLHEFTLLNYVANGLKNLLGNVPANSIFLVSDEFEDRVLNLDSRTLTKILWWSEYFAYVQTQGFNAFCNNLRLNIVKKGRKERNFELAAGHLFKFLEDKDLLHADDGNRTYAHLRTVAGTFATRIPEINFWTIDVAKAINEMIKLMYEDPEARSLTFNVCAITSTSITKYAEMFGGNELRETSSRILVKLARWLQVNEQVSLIEMNSLGKFLMVLPEIGMVDSNGIIPLNEMAIGKLLQFSVHQCSALAKAWYEFGSWCYRWGRKVIGKSADINMTLIADEDRSKIEQLLTNGDVSTIDLEQIFRIVSQTRVVADDEDIDSNEINTSEKILGQLNGLGVLHEDVQLALVEIWKKVQKRIYVYYELSAESYFKYLHLIANDEAVQSKRAASNSITVTLRLLRLIVKHALELQTVLEDGLASTPTNPWKVIIPQLFSRLNHPESYVRQRVSELLRRIAEDSPHLITFPAVVGALEGGVKFDFSDINLPKDCLSQSHGEEHEEELNDEIDDYGDVSDTIEEETKNDLQGCFKSMVETLSKQAPETINQVQLFVKELRRIILLWDELWLGTLAQHHGEISKRQIQLELEIEKVNENASLSDEEKSELIAEKYRIIVKPIIFVIEQLNDITSVEPETPHEKKFQERYASIIADVLDKLKNPRSPEKPEESWQLIKMLQGKFQQKVNVKGSYMLKMSDISPVLSGMRDTVIAMPGSSSTKVTISHVSNQVAILPTKTKPKKLIFHGSDGQNYTYLFKGLEDLHLDERIMQFLSIANTMMTAAHHDDNEQLYRARHYSVIPLGARSGLISWVDGTTPVFALYKRWQQREASKQSNGKSSGVVMRPSELFYHKLNPLLQENGVKNLENRKEWPFAILKQVLGELMNETPKDLVTKELWCHSVNSHAWWQMTRRYSYSVAVMSIIGYVIGLGDRHLDNVLIDLNSGEVVHIDYNVCFEKGKTLRVPEKVPFRLTPNFVDALGVTGTEGIFRLTCETVLKTMKKGRETLLTLLEAFVYDPLVDWTVGGGSLAGTTYGGVVGVGVGNDHQERHNHKELERDVTLSMYRVRCAELKFEWEENRDEIKELLPKLKDSLTNWLVKDEALAKTEDWLQDLHQQMALIKEAEANGISKHALYSLPNRYEMYKKKKEAMNFAKGDLENLAIECDDHLRKYSDALKLLDSSEFTDWYGQLSVTYESETASAAAVGGVFDLVKEFLQNAGKMLTIEQCDQSETMVIDLARKRMAIGLNLLHLLRDYSSVLGQCPSTFIERHRAYLYLKWSKYLQEYESVDACDHVYQQFYSLLEIKKTQLAETIVKYSYGLNILYTDTVKQIASVYDDLNKLRNDNNAETKIDDLEDDGDSTGGRSLEKNYEDAKTSVANFLRLEHQRQATNALEFVIVTELIILNQSFISLETVASRSGDYLLKLTLREGDWFLDELTLYSEKSLELLNYLPQIRNANGNNNSTTKIDDPCFLQTLNGLRAANLVYKSLQELNVNFHKIILPETMKKIQSEEVSVMQMIQEVNKLIVEIGVPLGELVLRLEKNLKCIVMKMDRIPGHDYITENLKSTRLRYQALLQSSNDQPLSQGKMLLMGLNGLFDKLDMEFDNLITLLNGIEVPTCWRKLDQVKDAKSLSAPIYDPRVRQVLADIFFLKRLESMSEFFALSLETSQSFRGLIGVTGVVTESTLCIMTDEQLNQPIRKYTADFISKQFLGVTTELIAYTICFLLQQLGLDVTHEIEQKDIGAENKVPLDDLSHKSWNQFLKNGVFTHNVLAQVSSLETNLKTAWEKLQEPKKLEKNLALLQSTLLRLQNQITLHCWLHDDILSPNIMPHCSFAPSKFAIELRNELSNLAVTREQLNEQLAVQENLISSVKQRLNWASGANPDVNEVLSAFETTLTVRDHKFAMIDRIVDAISTACQIILQHESLRANGIEAKRYDQRFLNYLDKFLTACQYNNSMKVEFVTSVEENIMRLYTPDLIKNPCWMTAVSEKISDIIAANQKELNERKCESVVAVHEIMDSLESLRQSYRKHGAVMSDFKSLLKSMTKIDEYAQQTLQYVTTYRRFAESFAWLTSKFMETSRDDVENATKQLNMLNDSIDHVYDGLMNLKGIKLETIATSTCSTTTTDASGKSGLVKQESNSKEQQKNAYAVSVWRRVKMKLEGRDPDPGRKYLTQEQVDYVIREATSLDNLALLYEGWTPWV